MPIKPVFHLGAVIGDETPMWDQRDEFGDTNLLVVKPEEGRSLARALGKHSAVLMLRHGATVVGHSLKDLVLRSIFICQNAEYQLRAHMLGAASPLYPGEIRRADVLHQQRAGVDRAWEYYCARLKKSGDWPPKPPRRRCAPNQSPARRHVPPPKKSGDNMLTSRRRIIPMLAGAFAAPLALRSGPVMAAENAFPDGFAWGASTSSYQIEGAVDVDGRGKSIWDIFCDTPGRVKNGDTGEIACDHYHRWPQDIELLARGGFNAYRFSTAWPRILPAGSGTVEARGLDFYDRLVDGLVARGITPWLCLYHWDLPQALQERGGWVNRDIAEKFADYGSVVARRLGDRVKHWAMFNEPNVHALFGYGMGGHAPGLTGLPNMLAAVHHQNLAQGRALQALRAERGDFRLGTVISLQPTRPSPGHEADKTAVARFDAFWTALSSIRCLRVFTRSRLPGTWRLWSLTAIWRRSNNRSTSRRQLLRTGVCRRRPAESVRRLVWRCAFRYALYRHGLAHRCRRTDRDFDQPA